MSEAYRPARHTRVAELNSDAAAQVDPRRRKLPEQQLNRQHFYRRLAPETRTARTRHTTPDAPSSVFKLLHHCQPNTQTTLNAQTPNAQNPTPKHPNTQTPSAQPNARSPMPKRSQASTAPAAQVLVPPAPHGTDAISTSRRGK